MSNYPPGVTGFEFEISGPDLEHDTEVICPICNDYFAIIGHRDRGRWIECQCMHVINYLEDVPDGTLGEIEEWIVIRLEEWQEGQE